MHSRSNQLCIMVALVLVAGLACSGEPSDGTTAGDAGDGDGDGDNGEESGDGNGTSSGDGDGEAETDPDCPPGTFDCPCDGGTCVEGLTCNLDDLCSLGGDTGDPTDT